MSFKSPRIVETPRLSASLYPSLYPPTISEAVCLFACVCCSLFLPISAQSGLSLSLFPRVVEPRVKYEVSHPHRHLRGGSCKSRGRPQNPLDASEHLQVLTALGACRSAKSGGMANGREGQAQRL